MCCCCSVLHRHQIHLISYGCVSLGLITTGLVFTIFAIFQKESQIGKVWLAGPTTMVVGLVLCGKVIIDWGPAMMHAREGSIDSGQMYSNHPFGPMTDTLPSSSVQIEPDAIGNGSDGKSTGSFSIPPDFCQPNTHRYPPSHMMQNSAPTMAQPLLRQYNPMKYPDIQSSSSSRYGSSSMKPHRSDSETYKTNSSEEDLARPIRAVTRPPLIYSNHSIMNSNGDVGRRISSAVYNHSSPRQSHSNNISFQNNKTCDCAHYGSMWRNQPTFQGESFVLNERNYLI